MTASLKAQDSHTSEAAVQIGRKGRADCRQSGDGFSLVKILAPLCFRVFQIRQF